MARHYRLTTTDSTASATEFNNDLEALGLSTVLTDHDQTFSERGEQLRADVYLADTEPLEDADSELKSVVEDAESATLRRRHTWREYDDETIADPDYYDVNAEKAYGQTQPSNTRKATTPKSQRTSILTATNPTLSPT